MQSVDEFRSAYSFDRSLGEVRTPDGRRMFLLSSEAWSALKRKLYDKFSSGASIILFDMGFAYGSDSTRLLRKRPQSPRQFHELVLRIGWGDVSLSGDLESGTRMSILLKNCVFCEEDNLAHPCDFFRGATVGFISELWGMQYSSSTNCSNDEQGHLCRFELNRA